MGTVASQPGIIQALQWITGTGKEFKLRDTHLFNLANPLWIQKTNPKSLYTEAQKQPSLPPTSDFLFRFCSGLDFSLCYHLGTFVRSFPPCASGTQRVHPPHSSSETSRQLVTLRQKRFFRGRSAGVTLPLQRHSPGKGTSLLPHPPLTGAPTAACLCQGAGALGHRALLGSLRSLARSLRPRVASLPLSTVSRTASRQPRGQGDRRSAGRPPQRCRRGRAAARQGAQPAPAPLRASPDLPPGRMLGFARHPGQANQRAAYGRPRGISPTRHRLLEAAPKRHRGSPAPWRPACQWPWWRPRRRGGRPGGRAAPPPRLPGAAGEYGPSGGGARPGSVPSGSGAGKGLPLPRRGSPPRLEAARHGGGGPRQSRRRSRRAALHPSGRGSRAAPLPSHSLPWHLAGVLPSGLWGRGDKKTPPKGAPTRVSGSAHPAGLLPQLRDRLRLAAPRSIPRRAPASAVPSAPSEAGGLGCPQTEPPRQRRPKQGAPTAVGALGAAPGLYVE